MKKLLVILTASSLLLAACGTFNEKQAYIDASIEAACLLSTVEDFTDPTADLENQMIDIYESYGLAVSTEAELEALSLTYDADEEVNAAIESGAKECLDKLLENLMNSSDLMDDELVLDEVLEEDMDLEVLEDEVMEDEILEDEILEDEVTEEVVEDEVMEDEVLEDTVE